MSYHSENLNDAPEAIGVYAIYLTSSPNKAYVGSTSNIQKRFKRHLWELERGKHPNYKLRRLYRNRREDFRFTVLETFDEISEARKYEQKVIDFTSDKNLYNIDKTVYAHRSD